MAARPPLSRTALVVAALVLGAFGIFVVFLVGQVDEDDVAWSRLAWIFASVEAIAFGAAGALFGSSIQRERAEKAEASARENAEAAANGKALAEVDQGGGTRREPGGGPPGARDRWDAGAGRESAANVTARHAELARRLFP